MIIKCYYTKYTKLAMCLLFPILRDCTKNISATEFHINKHYDGGDVFKELVFIVLETNNHSLIFNSRI